MSAWTHDGLAADLMDARHAQAEIAVERLAIAGRAGDGSALGGILDVATMRLSWSKPRITGYEVKVTRADFLRDTRAEKWRHYLPSVERLYFAVPYGLVELSEVPAECGLLVRNTNGWYTRRKPPVRRVEDRFHRLFVQAMLFRHYPGIWQPESRGLIRLANGMRIAASDIANGKARNVYGGKLTSIELPGGQVVQL